MNSEKAVLHILINDETYNALVGGDAASARVYYDEIKQGVGYPSTTVTKESKSPNDTKQNSDFDTDLIQVFHSAESKTTAMDMADKARAALTAVRNTEYNGVFVNEVRLIDSDSFTEKVVDKTIFTEEQIYRVLINN